MKVSGTEEIGQKEKMPKEYNPDIITPGYSVKNCLTVIF